MPTAKLWTNVDVDMQSVLASAVTITALTNADPGVATAASHGYSDTNYVLIECEGMTELNGRVFRIVNSDTNTFQLEDYDGNGIDTTDFGTFTSGTAKLITFGTSIGTVQNLTASGGEPNFVDKTTIHDTIQKQIPGLSSAISYALENIWDVSDAALNAMKAAYDVNAQRAFKFTFSDGQIMVFNGYVTATLIPTGGAQELVVTPVTITMDGSPSYLGS